MIGSVLKLATARLVCFGSADDRDSKLRRCDMAVVVKRAGRRRTKGFGFRYAAIEPLTDLPLICGAAEHSFTRYVKAQAPRYDLRKMAAIFVAC